MSRTHETQPDPATPPCGLDVQREGDVLRISRRWRSPAVVVVAPAGPIMLWLAISRFAAAPAVADLWDRWIVPLLLLLGAMILGYAAIVLLVNCTIITLRPDATIVGMGPLPTPFARRVRGPAVRSVDYRSETTVTPRSGGHDQYIDATLADGREVILMHIAGDDHAAARWVVKAIRDHIARHQ